MPAMQGAGRVDNPGLYRVLYAGDSATGAVAERFGNLSAWTESMFGTGSALAGMRMALVEYEAEALRVLDLDDPAALLERRLRPSRIVTPERTVTQQWARSIHEETLWDGVRWWSYWDSRWSSFGIWTTTGVVPVRVTPLSRADPAVQEASRRLARSWRRQ